ncbi:nucleoside deaminase [Streptomyces kasugaensis]|uniref:Nucleoside deaminase n=1 Tax=Streptomyces kasugaensis TaxID=1946 RepID=A0A4Q9HT48_STRKA|nr:nucleoside deaminase [Streptomyces kasugaensis]TBO58202.1 nucleoside deaminase [Streptomyces kasugaensis]
MAEQEFMEEAVRLATESVVNGWGGPFGAVITRDDEIIARGQNRVLLTGDPTAHGEVEAIRKAIQVLNPEAPSISLKYQNKYTLRLITREPDSPDTEKQRARMLKGCEIYTSGQPCPMCMSAIYWSRLDAVYFSRDLDDTAEIGFSDEFQYEDFKKPVDERSIHMEQSYPELGKVAYDAWTSRGDDKHPY